MYYTDEIQAQIVIALLKAHNISHVVASPGTTNMAFVGSVQTDSFFHVYSVVDERSAAYMACGMAAELNEAVVVSCTGATASRNYLPGLTEAYYRKLPVLALTSSQGNARAGHHVAQVIDRSQLPLDAVKLSVDLPFVKDAEDLWDCEIKVNRAILEMTRRGGGPVHINLPTQYSQNFNKRTLPAYRMINRWTASDTLPSLNGSVGVFIGSRKCWTVEETAVLEKFCEINNATIFCDHTSGYAGKYSILGALLGCQEGKEKSHLKPDTYIHIGEVSGDSFTHSMSGVEVWRVSPDGELRDTFRKLRHVFEMPEETFFRAYSVGSTKELTYYQMCKNELDKTRANLKDFPFSNIWLASQIAHQIPNGSTIHFAILNSLRAWNFFELSPQVTCSSNVGGFGIDGCLSSLIGASLVNPDKLFYLVIGDLAFFYDMNALGNRHLGSNIRILLVNNGKGTEFTQHGHAGSFYSHDANRFVAADGHFGEKSKDLVKGYAESLGLEYYSVSSKHESKKTIDQLLKAPVKGGRSILLEAFVDAEDESRALRKIRNIDANKSLIAKRAVKELVGQKHLKLAKRILRR